MSFTWERWETQAVRTHQSYRLEKGWSWLYESKSLATGKPP